MSAIEAIAIASPIAPAARIHPERDQETARPVSEVSLILPNVEKTNPEAAHVKPGTGTVNGEPGTGASDSSVYGDGPAAYAPPVPLVTFEGVEGSGKTTQLALAAERLRGSGRTVRTTREPGGTPIGERIRGVLLDAAHAELDPMAEWLLVEAARRQHVRDVVRPALESGAFLLCDRFSDSTEAYQVAGRGLDAAMVADLDRRVRGGIEPDLTLLYDLDPREGLARALGRDRSPGRFESAALEFHERVRSGFLAAARREPKRIAVLPAQGDADAVFALTWRLLAERFGLS
jgi:dTMP kinase